MKKLFITLAITGLISFLFGNYIFKVYKSNLEEMIKSASSIYDKVYMIQYGSYKDKEKAINNNLSNYILQLEDGFYKIYIGVALNIETAEKVKKINKEMGNEVYIKEKFIDNLEFIEFLSNNEIGINEKTNDEILNIQNSIIDKYKELKINE